MAANLTPDSPSGALGYSYHDLLKSYLATAYFKALNPHAPLVQPADDSSDPVAAPFLNPPQPPPGSIFESISPALNDGTSLEDKEAFLRDIVAGWFFATLGNDIAVQHMYNFLGPVGSNAGYTPATPDYPDGTKVSEDAATYNLGALSFPPLHDGPNPLLAYATPPHNSWSEIVIEKVNDEIKSNGGEIPTLYQDMTKIVSPLYLIFYPTDAPNLFNLFNPTKYLQPKKSLAALSSGDKSLFDLQYGFVEMDNPHDAEHYFSNQLEFDPDKFEISDDGKKVVWEANLTYQFDDYYDWSVGHVAPVFNDYFQRTVKAAIDPGTFTGIWAYDVRGAGLATPFSDSIEIERPVAGILSLNEKDPPIPNPKRKRTVTDIHVSGDPNEMVGPGGYGPQQYRTPATDALPYMIGFENAPEVGTIPAQEVFVTEQLDSNLDWSTFQLGSIGFGDLTIPMLPGLQSFETQVAYHNQDDSDLLVNVTGEFDVQTGIATWTFESADPTTGQLSTGVFDGFLPVEDGTDRGNGFINYSVKPKSGLVTGATIQAQASIVFDDNDPIVTNVFSNSIDSGNPMSAVSSLPASTLTTSFTVSWSGTDDQGGSGIAAYDVYVSDNGGDFTHWQTDTTATSASYSGVNGHSYAFYSVATDNVGYVQSTTGTAQATTVIQANSAPVLSGTSEVTYIKAHPPVAVVPNLTVTDTDENLGGGTLKVSITDVSTGKKHVRPDQLNVSSLSSVGIVASPQFVNGKLQVTVQLKANLTAAQLQAALRSVTFTTSSKGLKPLSRTVAVQVVDAIGAASNTFSQTINLLKKAPKPPRN
ncbi:MAG: Na-Ca exchanger/integrin-beta4 [Planctomycetaceae bacterium]|nr:Na-Ca exchanger/integrin-beta4 [Planctomycetaceae bacterium]